MLKQRAEPAVKAKDAMTEPKKKKPKPRRVQGPPGVDKPEAKKMGRPHLLTEDTKKKILDLIRWGNFPETAAAASGVSIVQMRAWLYDGAKMQRHIDEGKIKRSTLTKQQLHVLEFSEEVAISLAQSETRDVLLIARHAEKDWRAGAWRLERRHKKWAALTRVDATVAMVNADANGIDGKSESARDWVMEKIKRLSEAIDDQ